MTAMKGHVATAEVDVQASAERVWQAMTDPRLIAEYMFGSQVDTDWQVGSPIAWRGEYDGKSFEDHGTVVVFEPRQVLEVTHFSPLTGQEDRPENYHRVRYEVAEADGSTHVGLEQDNNGSAEEAEHSAANWQMMLDGLKRVAER